MLTGSTAARLETSGPTRGFCRPHEHPLLLVKALVVLLTAEKSRGWLYDCLHRLARLGENCDLGFDYALLSCVMIPNPYASRRRLSVVAASIVVGGGQPCRTVHILRV